MVGHGNSQSCCKSDELPAKLKIPQHQADSIRRKVATGYELGTRTGAGMEKHPKSGESLAPLRDEIYMVYLPDKQVWKLTPFATRIQIKSLNDCKTFSSKFTVVNTQVGNQSG